MTLKKEIEDLEKLLEVKRRKLLEEEDKNKKPPKLKENPDFSDLKKCISSLVEDIQNKELDHDDYQYYVFDEVIRALYEPKEFWNWWNANLNQ